MNRFFMLLCVFLLGNSHNKVTIELEAYIAELVELTVISDMDLFTFAEHLDKNKLVNPIDCKIKRCNAIETIHHEALEDLISEEIHKIEIKEWVYKLLNKRGHDHTQRKEIKEQTKNTWKTRPSLIAVGRSHACAVNKNHKPVCWGNTHTHKDISKASFANVREVAIGYYNTCMLEESGSLRCFEDLYSYRGSQTLPENLPSVIQVSLSRGSHNCVLEESGTALCWGENHSTQNNTPLTLGPLIQISAGDYHNCVLQKDATVHCWGVNWDKQCNVPSDLEPSVQVSAGGEHSCSLGQSGRVRCWGSNRREAITVPTDLGTVVQISASSSFSCALQESGIAKCWGPVPDELNQKLEELGNLAQIAVSDYQVCGINKNGKVHCISLENKKGTFVIDKNTLAPPEDLEVYVEDLLPASRH